jgi:ubiquinone/menaquinone biosynthesis C-methylase UbiE
VTASGPGPGVNSDHYSYTVYADPAMADSFDQARFGGPIGSLQAEIQARVIAEFAGPVAGRAALDVGTGTGRAALIMAEAGAAVTAIDASAEMLRVARARAEHRAAAIRFEVGDAHQLAHADRTFDVVVSLRVLMHTPGWRQCIRELCRVSRGRVIVDFPSAGSVAAAQALTRRIALAAGARVEAYRVFTEATIRQELATHGFRVTRIHRQFVLPIAFHKLFGSRAFTERVEGGLAAIGVLRMAGSPVTMLAER